VTTPRAFNPLDTENLGRAVAEALLESDAIPLVSLTPFTGAGIYAIYYHGEYALYEPISSQNRDGRFERPIYVGKAIPAGGRKGSASQTGPGRVLYNRVLEHADSITATKNLKIEEFQCRLLIVEDIWIPLAETLLIAMFSPVWNKLIDGFGNHDPGKGRYEGMRPRWDVLHPGRGWAEKCKERKESAEQIEAEVKAWLAAAVVPAKPMVFDSGQLLEELKNFELPKKK
jgi:hypothetical protein